MMIDVEKFIAWLGEFQRDSFPVYPEGIQPSELPLSEGEKVYAAHTEDFYISPEALFIQIEDDWIRLPWHDIREVLDVHLKGGYYLQFRTSQGVVHRYLWKQGLAESPIYEVIQHCYKELGSRKRIASSRRPIWEVPIVLRSREEWFRDYLEIKHPKEVPPLRAAYEAFEESRKTNTLTPNGLRAIVDCARSKLYRWQIAVDLLGEIALEHQAACDEISAMAEDRQVHVRYNALQCLSRKTPREFAFSMLQKALTDRSPAIRKFAVQQCDHFDLKEIIPNVERMKKTEKDEGVIRTLDFNLPLLRDGIRLKRLPDGNFSYCIKCTGSISEGKISEAELNSIGINTLVARVRADRDPTIRK